MRKKIQKNVAIKSKNFEPNAVQSSKKNKVRHTTSQNVKKQEDSFEESEESDQEFEDDDQEIEESDQEFEGDGQELEENDQELDDDDQEFEDGQELEEDDQELENDDQEFDESDEDEEDEDSEDDADFDRSGKITASMIRNWEQNLQDSKTAVITFKKIQKALSTVVNSMNDQEEHKGKGTVRNSSVVGASIFNAVVRLCLRNVPPMLHSAFGLTTLSDRPVKTKNWVRLSANLKKYLKDLTLLVKSISEPTNVASILKKGIVPLLPFYVEFSKLSWNLTKLFGVLWCTSDEKVRVLSLVGLFRLIRSFKDDQRDRALKFLYISYVSNCRFTSPTTWPQIDFMRMSLVELYGMDQAIAYRHAFLYIRQLVIHLRNAMLVQKAERLDLVYNWQYIHCVHFWADLLGKTHPSTVLQPLIYPLTQAANGILTLIKSPKYIPTTFHIGNILTELSHKTNTFIPVLPYLVEVLSCPRLHIKPKSNTLSPFDWNCILKVSTSQLTESAFTDGIIEQFFECSLKYLNTQCNSIAFPELVFPMTCQIKTFLKKCKISNYCRKIKQLQDKVNQNIEFINERRKNVPFAITDNKAIKNWEIECEQSNPPIRVLYDHWKSVKSALNKGDVFPKGVDEFSITALRKRQREEQDDENDEEEEEESVVEKKLPPPKKSKVTTDKSGKDEKKKNKKKENEEIAMEEEVDNEQDVVREMRLSDFEEDEDDNDNEDFELDNGKENDIDEEEDCEDDEEEE